MSTTLSIILRNFNTQGPTPHIFRHSEGREDSPKVMMKTLCTTFRMGAYLETVLTETISWNQGGGAFWEDWCLHKLRECEHAHRNENPEKDAHGGKMWEKTATWLQGCSQGMPRIDSKSQKLREAKRDSPLKPWDGGAWPNQTMV